MPDALGPDVLYMFSRRARVNSDLRLAARRFLCLRRPTLVHCFRLWFGSGMATLASPMRNSPSSSYLPPHLQEVCDLLARGLLRLRSRTAEETARDAADRGERLLHFSATQRVDANRTNRRVA